MPDPVERELTTWEWIARNRREARLGGLGMMLLVFAWALLGEYVDRHDATIQEQLPSPDGRYVLMRYSLSTTWPGRWRRITLVSSEYVSLRRAEEPFDPQRYIFKAEEDPFLGLQWLAPDTLFVQYRADACVRYQAFRWNDVRIRYDRLPSLSGIDRSKLPCV